MSLRTTMAAGKPPSYSLCNLHKHFRSRQYLYTATAVIMIIVSAVLCVLFEARLLILFLVATIIPTYLVRRSPTVLTVASAMSASGASVVVMLWGQSLWDAQSVSVDIGTVGMAVNITPLSSEITFVESDVNEAHGSVVRARPKGRVNYRQWYGVDANGIWYRIHQIVIPPWALLMLCMIFPAVHMLQWIRRTLRTSRFVRQGRCRECGYDLRRSAGACSECGCATNNRGKEECEVGP